MTLTEGDRNTYFYTRILLPGEPLIQESLDFVSEFHAKALDKNACEELTTWLEPDATGDNTTLHKVNIHSSLDVAELPTAILSPKFVSLALWLFFA